MGIVLFFSGINLGLLQLYCNSKHQEFMISFFIYTGTTSRVDCIFFLIVGLVFSL